MSDNITSGGIAFPRSQCAQLLRETLSVESSGSNAMYPPFIDQPQIVSRSPWRRAPSSSRHCKVALSSRGFFMTRQDSKQRQARQP